MFTRKPNGAVAIKARASGAAAVGLLGGLVGVQPAGGQDADSVTIDVGRCVELEAAAERLACLEARLEEAIEARGTESADSAAVSEARELGGEQRARGEASSRVDGGAQDSVEARDADETKEAESADDEYFGTIAVIRERLPETYVITLDNGQVWEQVVPKRYPLRPGLEVRIYATGWGESYRLSGVDSGSYIQVRRVR